MTLTGLDYPLERGILPPDACLGLGNHVAAEGEARIVLHEGMVVVLVDRGDESFRSLSVGSGE